MNALDDTAANTGDEDDATSLAIPDSVLAAFLFALTGAIITAVANAVSAVRPVPTPSYYIEIDLFDAKLTEIIFRDGRG